MIENRIVRLHTKYNGQKLPCIQKPFEEIILQSQSTIYGKRVKTIIIGQN